MARKKKATLNLGKLISLILLVVAVIMWFALPAIKHDVQNSNLTYSFLDMTFGKADVGVIITITYFEFSVLNLIPLVLLVLALLLSVLDLVAKKPLFNNAKLVNGALALLGGGLLFLVKTFAKTPLNMDNFAINIGVYAAAIPAIVAGLVSMILQ